jgi:hypothetical protein
MTIAVGYLSGEFYRFSSSREDLGKFLEIMDKATTIVNFNHTFTFSILEKYFPGRPGYVTYNYYF